MNFTEYLTEGQVNKVHESSLELLEELGMLVRHEKARAIFKKHGCIVDEAEQRVRFPAKVIEEYRKMTVPKFTFGARNPDFDITLPDDRPCIITASSAPNIIDPITGEERRATSEDIANIAFLVNELPGIDVFSISTLAEDAPDGHFSLARFYAAIKNCQKPIRGNTPNVEDLHRVLHLAEVVAGGKEAYMEHPFLTHHCCPVITPLTYDIDSTDLIITATEMGLPIYATIVPIGGLSAPLSLTGSLVLGNAEYLSVAALRNMIRPEAPNIYATLPVISDMRSGDYTPGAIETGMLHMAHSQMARFYGVPSGGYIGLTNSHLNDAQSGYETGMSTIAGLYGGTDMYNLAGLLGTLLDFDYGKLVTDNEIAMMLKKAKQGFETEEEDYCLELIKEIGPGKPYIEHQHTFDNMKTATYLPDVAVRCMRQTWEERGKTDTQARAMAIAKEILCGENSGLISDELDEKIREAIPGLVDGDADWPE